MIPYSLAETRSIPVVLIAPGTKWFGSQQLRQLKVVGALDDTLTPIELLQAIAKLFNWEEPNPNQN
ncbi:hypothetical protein ACQ4M3_25125 [Leptolyngbya sp. AN03gr2]|uniref:hypothetical protein n=1 Tax=unclassified Leptolyngbya TaxID=2650499 RepID=UPI003D3190C0